MADGRGTTTAGRALRFGTAVAPGASLMVLGQIEEVAALRGLVTRA